MGVEDLGRGMRSGGVAQIDDRHPAVQSAHGQKTRGGELEGAGNHPVGQPRLRQDFRAGIGDGSHDVPRAVGAHRGHERAIGIEGQPARPGVERSGGFPTRAPALIDVVADLAPVSDGQSPAVGGEHQVHHRGGFVDDLFRLVSAAGQPEQHHLAVARLRRQGAAGDIGCHVGQVSTPAGAGGYRQFRGTRGGGIQDTRSIRGRDDGFPAHSPDVVDLDAVRAQQGG